MNFDMEFDLQKISPERFFVLVQFLMVMIISFFYILPGAYTDKDEHKNWNKFSYLVLAAVNFIVMYLPAISALLLENPSSMAYFGTSIGLFALGSGATSISNCNRAETGEGENNLLTYNSPLGNIVSGVDIDVCTKAQLSTFLFGSTLKNTAVSTALGGIIAYFKEMY